MTRPRPTRPDDASALLVFVFFAVAVLALLAAGYCDGIYNPKP